MLFCFSRSLLETKLDFDCKQKIPPRSREICLVLVGGRVQPIDNICKHLPYPRGRTHLKFHSNLSVYSNTDLCLLPHLVIIDTLLKPQPLAPHHPPPLRNLPAKALLTFRWSVVYIPLWLVTDGQSGHLPFGFDTWSLYYSMSRWRTKNG